MSAESPVQRRIWAVVPAAGAGLRMGAPVPKQYLPLCGRPVIAHTLERLCNHTRIDGVVVVLSAADEWWQDIELSSAQPPLRATGGAERCDSVLSGLERLAKEADSRDWVLVHDAARPCLRDEDIDRLIDAVTTVGDGGLLGVPVRDTMKRTDAHGQIIETVEREALWHALTPQMFVLADLQQALRQARERGITVTDEAQAMELSGLRPRMVEGHADNIKITRQEDLALAEYYLRSSGCA